jgi:hypothetical protein
MNCKEAYRVLSKYYNGEDVELATVVRAYEHIFEDLPQKIVKCQNCRKDLEEKIKNKKAVS